MEDIRMGYRVPVTTTIEAGFKAKMIEQGLNFSTALALGCQELIEKKEGRKTSQERAEGLALMLRQIAAALPEGQSIGDLVIKGKEKGVQ